MEQISNSNLINDVDIAVAAWHEDGRWTLALLPDAHDLAQIIDRLKSQQTNGGAIALIAIDEEFFMLIRVHKGLIVRKVSDRTFLLHLGGKLEVQSKVPLKTRDDLSRAYTPGVARICQAIAAVISATGCNEGEPSTRIVMP